MVGHLILDLLHRHLSATQFPTQGGDSLVHEAARVYGPEALQACVDVEGQSVHGHTACHFHSNRTDFPFHRCTHAHPYAGGALHTCSLKTIFSHCADYRLFQTIHIFFHSKMMREKVDYRINDELTRAMICNVAAPFDANTFGAGRESEHILHVTVLAEGVDIAMLGEVDTLRRTRYHLCLRLMLQIPDVPVGSESEVNDFHSLTCFSAW